MREDITREKFQNETACDFPGSEKGQCGCVQKYKSMQQDVVPELVYDGN